MNFADLARGLASSVTRSLPHFRGLGTLYRLLNAGTLKLGAKPLATARMRDGTGILVDLRTLTDLDAFYRGEYDPDLLKVIRSLLDPDSLFLDVGANIGFYTVAIGAWIRSRGGSGRVIAFEPLEGNFQRLLENLQANDLAGFCSAQNVGLSNRAGDSLITLREDFLRGSTTGNAAIPTHEKFDEGFRKVPIRLDRLDTLWPAIRGATGRIDFMKMDIEGHEDLCLEGARQTLDGHRPTILMEVNKPYYGARGVALDAAFLPRIPGNYAIYGRSDARWKRIDSLESCRTIDNVFLVPAEKSGQKGYDVFE